MATPGPEPSPSAAELKAPVWTWEVPTYFFVGGVAGISALIAAVATVAGAADAMVRAARLLATGGAALSPLLLISDLGRPARFLYMLRVFKLRSAMSVGVWTLVVFSGATTTALALWMWEIGGPAGHLALGAVDLVAAVTGVVLATYTGVLLGATVLPVWASRHRSLPLEFGISSLGAAASAVELLAGPAMPLARAATAAAVVETGLWLAARRQATGWPNRATMTAAALSGPVALGLRLVALAWSPVWPVAGLAALAGSLVLRFAWIEAGRADAASMRK